jgi:hypothetical protein
MRELSLYVSPVASTGGNSPFPNAMPDFAPFFELAGRSPTRRKAFLQLAVVHVVCLGFVAVLGVWGHSQRVELPTAARATTPRLVEWLGWTLLVAGIVEGALVVGWRLTQLPKSRALEPLLLSPAPAWQTLLGEQLVGLVQLLWISLAGVPVLAFLVGRGYLPWEYAAAVWSLGFGWGVFTGVALAWWAYEPDAVRRWGERVILGGVAAFLLFFGIFSEHSRLWLARLPGDLGWHVERWLHWSNRNNPFDLVHRIALAVEPLADELSIMAIGLSLAILAMMVRTSLRLKAHYLERNYRPRGVLAGAVRPPVGDRPIAWWAVKRVNEYPGKVNLYLAAGAAVLYATYLIVGDANWPTTFGRQVFRVYEAAGGVAGFGTVLALLAAVPAAYQYGLWDSSIPERCKRLETYLPTKLNAFDYLHASLSASWNRGRGYFVTAVFLWLAAAAGGRLTLAALLVAVACALALFLLYFAIGFRAFASARGNTSLGFALTVVLPLAAWALGGNGFPSLAGLTPPGSVFFAISSGRIDRSALAAVAAMIGVALYLLWQACRTFDGEIRTWYDRHLGRV